MKQPSLTINQSHQLSGTAYLLGAKNAALPLLASLILTKGISTISNIPFSSDITHMLALLQDLGAVVLRDEVGHVVQVDTTKIGSYQVCPRIMAKMRASIVVAGPLLARFGKARVALPGGCVIGSRPIDQHLRGFVCLDVTMKHENEYLNMNKSDCSGARDRRIVFEYPSVGATQNCMMLAVNTPGRTTIVNAAHEPEIFDLVEALNLMGACITLLPGNQIEVIGVEELEPIEYCVLPDRLEAGVLLLAAAMTGGRVKVEGARGHDMDMFLEKLREMGHTINVLDNSVELIATQTPHAVSFKTGPYPGFPTDLQAPMMAAQCLADGVSVIEETVFENRLMHVKELQKLGAQIDVRGNTATVRGVDELYGAHVIATDIRASYALGLAGLVAQEQTTITGMHHWNRGLEKFEDKLISLGGKVHMGNTTEQFSRTTSNMRDGKRMEY